MEKIPYTLNYSRVEIAADARHRVCSCGPSPQMPCNEADAVRSARSESKKMAIKIKNKRKVSIIIFEKILHVIEKKRIIKTSPFFMNRSG